MRLGICGGTFDPIHRGHLGPLLAVYGSMGWAGLIVVPARTQPFKQDVASASPFHRFAMAVLATEHLEDVRVSPIELERDGVSYTVDTLEVLRAAMPQAGLEWVIGDDHLEGLPRWKSPDRIFELANIVVLRRQGSAARAPQAFEGRVSSAVNRPDAGAIVFAGNEIVPVSSTEIRRRVRDLLPIDDLVDPRVARYIEKNRLYQEPPEPAQSGE